MTLLQSWPEHMNNVDNDSRSLLNKKISRMNNVYLSIILYKMNKVYFTMVVINQ